MITIEIIGTDWEGTNPQWLRQPFTDGGRLQFDRRRREDWDNLWHETGTLARVDAVAVGIRGANDTPAVACLPLGRASYDAAARGPSLLPWFDTGGLPDNTPGQVPFDFANDEHLHLGWEKYGRIFYDHFRTANLQRSKHGRVLCAWWGIATKPKYGLHGFVNQHRAQWLLDLFDAKLIDLGLGTADHIVDKTWFTYAPDLRVHGRHDWFEASLGQFQTIRTHNGVKTGVVVPSFAWPGQQHYLLEPDNGQTLARALGDCVTAGCDYLLIEGHTDTHEGAEVTRTAKPDDSADDSKLRALRTHMDRTTGTPEPPEPPPPPIDEDEAMLKATFSLRRSERKPHPTEAGYYTSPYPGKPDKVLSVTLPDGDIAERDLGTHGDWEMWREEGNKAVFDRVFGYTFAIPLVN